MRKKNLHVHQGSAGAVLYLDSLHAYKNAFLAEHEKVKSWREVARPYKIHPNMARLITGGYNPGNKIRRILRLPDKEAVEVCITCGMVHITKRCKSGNHKKRNRLSINLDNPESAAKSIMNHMDSEKVNDLIVVLMEEMLMERK